MRMRHPSSARFGSTPSSRSSADACADVWQVEGLTQGTRWENVLRDSFGGVLSNELLADGGKYSERSEPFYYLIVPVRGHSAHSGVHA